MARFGAPEAPHVPISRKASSPTSAFAVGSSEVQPQFRTTLEEIARPLKTFNQSFIDVLGHTDTTGTWQIGGYYRTRFEFVNASGAIAPAWQVAADFQISCVDGS